MTPEIPEIWSLLVQCFAVGILFGFVVGFICCWLMDRRADVRKEEVSNERKGFSG